MGREQDILGQVEQLLRLSSPEPVIIGLQKLASRPGIGRDELVDLLSLDPGLTCQILRKAGERAPLSSLPTLEEAAQHFSQQELHQLLGEAVPRADSPVSSEKSPSPPPGADAPSPAALLANEHRKMTRPLEEDRPEEGLWGHAVGTALACRLVAQHLGKPLPGGAYLAGLLHDLGKDALLAASRTSYRQVRFTALRERLPYFEAERRCRLPQHIQLGHALACRWGLPRTLREVIFRHHEPNPLQRGDIDPLDSFLVDLVIVGDGIARRLQLGNPLDPLGSPAWGALTRKRIGLERSDMTMLSLKLARSYQAIVMDLFGRTFRNAEGLEEANGA